MFQLAVITVLKCFKRNVFMLEVKVDKIKLTRFNKICPF